MNTIQSLSFDGMIITYKKLENNNMPRSHTHTNFELYYSVEGERYLFIDKKCYTVKEGDAFIVPPGVEHRTLDGKSIGYTSLVCNLPKSKMLTDLFTDKSLHFVRPNDALRALLLKESEKIHSLLSSDNEKRYINIVASVFNMLSSVVNAEDSSTDAATASPTLDRVGDIMNYLESHFSEKITLTHLSEHFFISEYYLSRLFKQCTSKNLWDYLTKIRIEKAKTMLLNTNEQINVISKKCGFYSVSAFDSAFKKLVGESAGKYKKANSEAQKRVKQTTA